MSSTTELKNLTARIKKLEKTVYGSKKSKALPTGKFEGPKGGVLLLISKNYLNKKRTAREVMTELEKNDYHYRIQVVQTTLNRLSSTKGPLTALNANGHKIYVKRK